MNLNFEQSQAVQSTALQTLVVAGPGSGKTATLAHRIVHRIYEGVPPEHIVAITYTNAAAAEIQQRVDGLRSLADEAVNRTKLGYIGTIHGYALRLLGRYGHRLGLPPKLTVLDEAQAEELLLRCASDLHYKGTRKALDEAVAQMTRDHCTPDDGDANALSPTELVAFDFFSQMARNGALSFDGILAYAACLVKDGAEPLDADVDEMLVDEYQDANDLVHAIVTKHPSGKFVVGDPDQAIYGFAGGRVANILDLYHSPDWQVFSLENNYRSVPAICAAAHRLIVRNKSRIQKRMLPTAIIHDGLPTQTGVTVRVVSEPIVEWSTIAGELHRATMTSRSSAVLCRSNALATEAASYFEAAGLPVRKRQWKEKPEDWGTVRRFIALAANPANDMLAHWFFKLTQGAAAADRILLEATDAGRSINDHALHLPDNLDPDEVPRVLQRMVVSNEALELVQTAINNLLPEHGIADLCVALGDAELHWKDIGDGIVVTTIHGAKGREWDWVFVAGCDEELMPGKKTGMELEEERRLMFVALTRARQRVWLTTSKVRRAQWQKVPAPASPSRFLAELEGR